MLMLAIDTATTWQSIAVVKNDLHIGEINFQSPFSHSVTLMNTIDYLLKTLALVVKNLDVIAVSIGPGSFTGLRIGIASAKSMAYSLKIPIVGITTLQTLAWSVKKEVENTDNIIPLIDAKRNEVYGAVYRIQNNRLVNIEPEKTASLQYFIKDGKDKNYFCGDAAGKFRSIIKESNCSNCFFSDKVNYFPRAVYLAELANIKLKTFGADDLHSLLPQYLRNPDIRT